MANNAGREAKRISRRCLTLVKVTTPTVPRTPLPTKFAVAEKHMAGFLPGEITLMIAKRKNFWLCTRLARVSLRQLHQSLGPRSNGPRHFSKVFNVEHTGFISTT